MASKSQQNRFMNTPTEQRIAWIASNMDILVRWMNAENSVPQSIRHTILESQQITDSLSKGLQPATVRRQVHCHKCGAVVWELDVPAVKIGTEI